MQHRWMQGLDAPEEFSTWNDTKPLKCRFYSLPFFWGFGSIGPQCCILAKVTFPMYFVWENWFRVFFLFLKMLTAWRYKAWHTWWCAALRGYSNGLSELCLNKSYLYFKLLCLGASGEFNSLYDYFAAYVGGDSCTWLTWKNYRLGEKGIKSSSLGVRNVGINVILSVLRLFSSAWPNSALLERSNCSQTPCYSMLSHTD